MFGPGNEFQLHVHQLPWFHWVGAPDTERKTTMRKMFQILGDVTGCAALFALLWGAIVIPQILWGL